MKTVVLISYWAGHVPHFEAMWSSTWAEVAPKRVQLGAKLRHVGAKVGPYRIKPVHLADVGL